MKCRIYLFALALLISLALPTKSFGQAVRHDNVGYNLLLRLFERAAKDQNAACWPLIPKGQTGTWALVTFDTQNCDITFVTRRSYPASSLLRSTKTVARLSRLPLANYIISESLHTRAVDLELNPYLVRSRFHTRIGLPLGQIADAIGKAGFPNPIALAVDATGSTHCNLTSASHPITVDNYWFAAQRDIPADSNVNFDAHLTWRSWLNLALMTAVALLVIVFTIRRLRKKTSGTPTEASALSPEEAQRRYDKSIPRWILLFLPAITVAVVFLLTMESSHDVTVFSFLSPSTQTVGLFMLLIIITALGVVMSRLNNRRANGVVQKMPAQLSANRKIVDPKILLLPLFAFVPMLALMVYILLNPPLTFRQSRIDHWLIYACQAIGFLLIAYFLYRTVTAARGKRTPAPEEWRQMVFDLANLRGVPVKHVVVVESPIANAYATAFGTVGITSRLLAEFPPEQVKAIIAHELGHLKAGHPQRRFAIVGAAFVTVNALLLFVINYEAAHANRIYAEWRQFDFMAFYLINPSILIIFGKWFRRNEAEADAFSVSAIGDTETVIAALQHLHEVNGSPSKLRPADEAISTHPSLENRIKAIRNLSQRVT